MDKQDYAKHIQQINEGAYASLLLSVGHKLGLFDLMMRENRPLTSIELANIAGMKERYVREWLKGVAVAKMVCMDTRNNSFFIPEEHHDTLKFGKSLVGGVQVCSRRFENLKKYFELDGPYSFDTFDDDFWSWYSAFRYINLDDMLDETIPHYKEGGIYDKLVSGIDVLDVCCGSGEFMTKLAIRFPNSDFTGVDLNKAPLDRARDLIETRNLKNCKVVQGDILDLPDMMSGSYDLITMEDSLHDLPDPHKALTQIKKALKTNGTFALSEFSMSANTSDNIGNLGVSLYLACSIFICLPSGLSVEPRAGYGTCWGRQNVLAALEKEFEIQNSFKVGPLTSLDICKKK